MKTILTKAGLSSLVQQSNGLKWELCGHAFYSLKGDIQFDREVTTDKLTENGTIILRKIEYRPGKNGTFNAASSTKYKTALNNLANNLFAGTYMPSTDDISGTISGTYTTQYDPAILTLGDISKVTKDNPMKIQGIIIFGQSYYQVKGDGRKVYTSEGLVPVAIVDMIADPAKIYSGMSESVSFNITTVFAISGVDDLSDVNPLSGTEDKVVGSMQVVNDGIGTEKNIVLVDNEVAIVKGDLNSSGTVASSKKMFLAKSLTRNVSNDFGSPARLNIMKESSEKMTSPQMMLSMTTNDSYTKWEGATFNFHRMAAASAAASASGFPAVSSATPELLISSVGAGPMGLNLMSEKTSTTNGSIVIGGNNSTSSGKRIAIGGKDNFIGKAYGGDQGVLVNTIGSDTGRGGGTLVGTYYGHIYYNIATKYRSGSPTEAHGSSVIVGGDNNEIHGSDGGSCEVIVGGRNNYLYSTDSCSTVAAAFNQVIDSTNSAAVASRSSYLEDVLETFVTGRANKIFSSSFSNIAGQANYIERTVKTSVNGYKNDVRDVKTSDISGEENTVHAMERSVISGVKNVVKGRADSIVVARGANVYGNIDKPVAMKPTLVVGEWPMPWAENKYAFQVGGGTASYDRLDLMSMGYDGTFNMGNQDYHITINAGGIAFINARLSRGFLINTYGIQFGTIQGGQFVPQRTL